MESENNKENIDPIEDLFMASTVSLILDSSMKLTMLSRLLEIKHPKKAAELMRSVSDLIMFASSLGDIKIPDEICEILERFKTKNVDLERN